MPGPEFLSGVIEGFYGRPWSFEQRAGLLPRLRDLGFNTYVYAPKDDIKLRTRWREQYDGVEADRLSALVRACQQAGVRFVYAISPGLDVRYGEPADLAWLVGKVDRVLSFWVHDVALLFDDISHSLPPARTTLASTASPQRRPIWPSHSSNTCATSDPTASGSYVPPSTAGAMPTPEATVGGTCTVLGNGSATTSTSIGPARTW